MRFDIEQAKKYLQGMHRLWLCDEWEQPYDSERCRGCDSHDNCLDIVLASESMSDIAQDLYDTIEALQQENEQLRAQVVRMREALIFTKEKIYEQLSNYVNDPKKFKYSAISIECVQKIIRALADASDYHNPTKKR